MRIVLGVMLCGMAALAQDEPTADAAAAAKAAQTRTYKKIPQGELALHLYFPPGCKAEDKRPAVVFFFGGGWAKGSPQQFAPQAAHLASRGMVAACADYRVKGRHGVTPDACVEDAKSAVRWIRKNAATLGVDPARIVAAGGSAGGHIAVCTAVIKGFEAEGEDHSVSSRPDVLVGFNPALDLDALTSRMPGKEDVAKAIAPLLHLQAAPPPTLMMYGTADPFIKGGQAFVDQARALGAVAEMMTADGQPHAFFNKAPWLERTLDRMDEFLVGLGWLKPRE